MSTNVGILTLIVMINTKKVNEYDQEIPQSQTADNPMAPDLIDFKQETSLIVGDLVLMRI